MLNDSELMGRRLARGANVSGQRRSLAPQQRIVEPFEGRAESQITFSMTSLILKDTTPDPALHAPS